MRRPDTGPWNHNTHFYPLVLQAVRQGSTALDVGCGEGMLTRQMVTAGAGHVTGIDSNAAMVALARSLASVTLTTAQVEYVSGDVLTSLPGRSFDLVACVAALHHFDLDAGLARLGELTAPGGRLVVVGLARPSTALDRLASLATVPLARVAGAVRDEWVHPAPTVDPTETYDEVRAATARLLPSSTFRARLYWRYTVEWRAPA